MSATAATSSGRLFESSVSSPVGVLNLAADADSVLRVSFARSRHPIAGGGASGPLAAVAAQLEEYFAGQRELFELPLRATGSPFELAVWQELERIPFGQTRSYGEVARAAGYKADSARAVGVACARNPLAIVVPCHRVLGADGRLVGYGGGIDNKAWLLAHEGATLAAP